MILAGSDVLKTVEEVKDKLQKFTSLEKCTVSFFSTLTQHIMAANKIGVIYTFVKSTLIYAKSIDEQYSNFLGWMGA